VPSLHGLGQFLSAHRQAVLSLLELLILLALFVRWYDRRHGLRRTARRTRRWAAEAGRDLIAPIAEVIRLRRGVRVVAARLTESDPAATVRDALASALAELAGRVNAWPYLVLVGPRELTVGIACPDPAPLPESEVWRQSSARRWNATRPVSPPPPFDRDAEPLPVVVGVSGDDLVLLDLGRAPGIVSVHGAVAPVDRLVSALAAQLAAGLCGAPETLLVHDAFTATAGARPLPELTAELERRPVGRHPRTVLVCARPETDDIERLTELAGRDPGLLVLVAGYMPGSRWRLRVTTAGRVVAPELGVDADSAPLWKGLERALGDRLRPDSPAAPPVRPIWADEGPAAPTPDRVPAELPVWLEPVVPRLPAPPAPAVATNDLIESAAAPEPMARSGADSAANRSGDR